MNTMEMQITQTVNSYFDKIAKNDESDNYMDDRAYRFELLEIIGVFNYPRYRNCMICSFDNIEEDYNSLGGILVDMLEDINIDGNGKDYNKKYYLYSYGKCGAGNRETYEYEIDELESNFYFYDSKEEDVYISFFHYLPKDLDLSKYLK